jgi:hypothetical protein
MRSLPPDPTHDEMYDPVLGLGAFVGVIVPREDDAHVVPDEQRRQRLSQRQI